MLESLEQVAAAVGTLASETRTLANEVRIENQERKRQLVLQMVLTALTLTMLVLLVVQVFRQASDATHRSQVASEQRQAQLALAQQINDCISPQGVCYQRNQAAQAAAIQQLIESSVNANRCSVEAAGSVTAFDACLKAKGITVIIPSPAPR